MTSQTPPTPSAHATHRFLPQVIAAATALTLALPAQFTTPYAGVGPAVRVSPQPIVVMKYEPETPYSHDRYMMFGREGNRLFQIAKNRSNTWHSRVEVPFVSGLVPADDPVAFHNPEASVVSLFVLGSDGTIYQATGARYAPFGSWSGWSALPNAPAMASTCVAVNTPNGLGVSAFAIGYDGLLYNAFYSRGAGGGWGSWTPVPNSPQLIGRPTVVNGPPGGQEINLFATDRAGVIRHVRFVRGVGPGTGWTGWSSLSGPRFVGSPSCYALGSLVSVFATADDGQVYQAVRGSGGWGSWSSLGGPSSGSFVGGPAAVNSPDESSLEILARTDANTVELRTYDRTGGGWSSWGPTPIGGTLTSGPTIQNWHTRTSTLAETRAVFFGAQRSVAHWFGENSQGRFPVSEAYISNWLEMPDDPNTPVNESSYEFFHGSNYAEKARIMIQNFERLTGYQFRWANYDTDGNGIITTEELMVYWVYPGEGARVRGTPICINVGPSLCVQLTHGLPRSAAQIGPETICEELCHGLFGLDDLYPTPQLPGYVGPGRLSLISNNAEFPHLHPWGKLKLGWVAPTVVTQDGWYRLRPIEFHQDLLVLHDPARGPRDYFLVENRWPDGSIEATLPDRGIGVWRIGEHYEGQSFWGRRTIKLLRAGGGNDDTIAFWDASDPRTSYHLTPTSVPANSLWDGGASSNIALYHPPVASPNAWVYVDVPPLRSAPPPPRTNARYDYIDQQPPYTNQSPPWLTAQGLPILGTSLDVQVPSSFVQGTNITTYYLVFGGSSPGVLSPVFAGYLYASLDVLLPMAFGVPGQTQVVSIPLPDVPELSGAQLYQQVLRIEAGRGFPLTVSRGGRVTLGY